MKTISCLLAALLCGCSHQIKETTVDITGIDGFRLGEKLGGQYKCDSSADGGSFYFDDQFTGAPPFRVLSINLIGGRQIANISLSDLSSDNPYQSYNDAFRTLKSKYGEPIEEPSGRLHMVIWLHGHRQLSLMRTEKTVAIQFSDTDLMHAAEFQRRSLAKDQLSGLIK